jgi:hypothetical protein
MPHRYMLPESTPESMPGVCQAERMPGTEHTRLRLCTKQIPRCQLHSSNTVLAGDALPKCRTHQLRDRQLQATSFCHSRNGNCTLGRGAQPMFHRAVMGRHFSTACLPARTAELDRATTRPLLCLAPRAEVALIVGEAAGMLCRIFAGWQGVPRRTVGKRRPLSRSRARRNR